MPATLYTSNGMPLDSVGADGDMNYDYSGRFIWGPKGRINAGTWTGTANNTNPLYSSVYGLPAMATGWGVACQFAGQTMGTVAQAANSVFMFNGTNIPYTFTPQADCILAGIQASNFGSSGATVFFYLQNLTTSQTVATYNSGNGIAAGTIGYQSYSIQLKAGNTYQFQGTRSSAGATFMQINPQITLPSSSSTAAVSFFPTQFVSPPSATTIAAGGTVIFQNAGLAPQTGYYKNPVASYVYYLTLTVSGSGVVGPYFFNETANTNGPANFPSITLSSTPQTVNFGPFASGVNPFAANSQQRFGLYNASGGATVNPNAIMQMQVGQ